MVSSTHPPSHIEAVPHGVTLLRSPENRLLEALRAIHQLEGLTEEEYLWLIRNSRESSAPAGTRLFDDGDPAHYMTILLAGEIQVRRKKSGQENILIGRSGNLTGMMPFSRMKSVGGAGIVTEDIWALQISKESFPEMLAAIPSMGQRCVSVLLDRTREVTRLEQQSEKLNALGKLAANLAHELNNPASAAQRAAGNLLEELKIYGNVSFHAGRLCLTEQQEQRYMEWCQTLRAAIAERAPQPAPHDGRAREDRLLRWLEDRKIVDAWSIAPVFAESRIEPEDLLVLDEFLNHEASTLALRHYASGLRAERMTAAVLDSTARIFKLIQAIQQYSHMDQGSLQDIDLAQSLDNTLSMLHYRLHRVNIVREYQCDLPRITANGGELNQIWMALLENALDATQDAGTIRLTTRQAGDMVQVEIWDDGPGIPPELHSRIFEPFFTTKPVGTAPGLGLDSVRRMVTRYRGFIEVQSKPGATCFQVRLPLKQTGAY
jgi:signal transduction histidine kinase